MRLGKSTTETLFLQASVTASNAERMAENGADPGKIQEGLAKSLLGIAAGLAHLTVSLEKKGVIVKD
jgi:hypothetical protein